jgi:hypothetical protein
LSGKREKKVIEPKIKSIEKKTIEPAEQKSQDKTKSVGWEYRYRVSKMRDAQKHAKSKVSPSKKQEKVQIHQQLDPELAQLTPEERIVGWNYRLVEYTFLFQQFHLFILAIVFVVNLIHPKILLRVIVKRTNVRKNENIKKKLSTKLKNPLKKFLILMILMKHHLWNIFVVHHHMFYLLFYQPQKNLFVFYHSLSHFLFVMKKRMYQRQNNPIKCQ